MSDGMSEIFKPIDRFFSSALAEYGAVHKAVDWADLDQQIKRFKVLTKLFDTSEPFDVLDYGCGYGAMLDYLKGKHAPVMYWGYDISEAMLKAARDTHPGLEDRFLSELPEGRKYDYVV